MRVLFCIFKNTHLPILTPIIQQARLRRDWEIGVWIPSEGYLAEIRAGFKLWERHFLPTGEDLIRVRTPQEFSPHLTFIADAIYPYVQRCGKVVNVGHGLLSKGQYYTDTHYTHRDNLAHLLLVPGEYHKERLMRGERTFIPVEVMGYPKLDDVVNGKLGTREELCRRAGLDPNRKIILYAPTFNIALSAVPILWTRIRLLATPDRYLLIKLHGSTLAEFEEHHIRLAMREENIKFIADPNLAPYLHMADVMVSDVSSAFMEFVLLDKPVVLFNNPNQKEYVNYDERDIEYAWRDVGLQVSTIEETIEAVERSLNYPQELKDRREWVRHQLRVPLDGKASQRAIELGEELVEKSRLFAPLIPRQKVLAIVKEASGECKFAPEEGERWENLWEECGEEVRLCYWNGEQEGAVPIIEQCLSGSWEFIVLWARNVFSGERWLFRLLNHFYRDPELEAVVPQIWGGLPSQSPTILWPELMENLADGLSADESVRCQYPGMLLTTDALPHPAIGAVRRGTKAFEALLSFLRGEKTHPFENSLVAADVVAVVPFQEEVLDPRLLRSQKEFLTHLIRRRTFRRGQPGEPFPFNVMGGVGVFSEVRRVNRDLLVNKNRKFRERVIPAQ